MGVGWVPGDWVGGPSDSLSLKIWTWDLGIRTEDYGLQPRDFRLRIVKFRTPSMNGEAKMIQMPYYLTRQKTMICNCSAISV